MRIGQIAKAVDCHVETVRYYEKIGMLSLPLRSPNGYRDYTTEHLKQLRLIRRARSLGFSQNEVRSLVELASANKDQCDQVYNLTLKQLNVIDTKLREMQRIKKALRSLATACEEGDHENCPVLDDLAR